MSAATRDLPKYDYAYEPLSFTPAAPGWRAVYHSGCAEIYGEGAFYLDAVPVYAWVLCKVARFRWGDDNGPRTPQPNEIRAWVFGCGDFDTVGEDGGHLHGGFVGFISPEGVEGGLIRSRRESPLYHCGPDLSEPGHESV